ncbi:asparaginase, partial [Streptomyces sp. NPDC058964]
RVRGAAAALARAGVGPELLTGLGGEPLLGGGEPVGCVRPVRALDPVPLTACA